MDVKKFTLTNGTRVLAEPVGHVQSAAIGLWCTTGSRHESDEEAGITHFIEHMLFKGTATRTSKQIAEEIEGRGGILNAFTDKEYTCYYCRVLSEDVEVAIEVLSDMLANSLIDPEELEREKGVVLEEIKRGEDEPSDHVHELHLCNRWGRHPLGKPVIGTSDSVSSFNRGHLTSYMDRRYRGENILLAASGNVDPDRLKTLAEAKLASFSTGATDDRPSKPAGKSAVNNVAKDVEQIHFCIGSDSCSLYDQNLYVTAVLDAALGGGMSSRLFQEVREKRGLAYAIGSYNLGYTTGGAFTVFGGTSPKTWGAVQEVVHSEFDKIRDSGLDEAELKRIKKNISGNIVLALEGMSARMMRMARNEIYHHREIPLEETLGKIEAVSNEQVIEVSRQILDEKLISTTAIGPF